MGSALAALDGEVVSAVRPLRMVVGAFLGDDVTQGRVFSLDRSKIVCFRLCAGCGWRVPPENQSATT